MKTLHSADWHVKDADIDEISQSLEKIVETAAEERPDLIVIAGDLFHSQDVKLDSPSAKLVIKTVSALADIAPVAIVIGTSSHDGRAPEILEMVRGEYPVLVAAQPMQVVLNRSGEFVTCADNEGYGLDEKAIISLIPQVTKQFLQVDDQAISEAMNGIFLGFGAKAHEFKVPHVLVYHGSISGAKLSNSQDLTGRDIEISRDQIALSGADLTLCGHIHLPQEIQGSIFYSGSIYPVNWGEDHGHGFYVHEVTV